MKKTMREKMKLLGGKERGGRKCREESVKAFCLKKFFTACLGLGLGWWVYSKPFTGWFSGFFFLFFSFLFPSCFEIGRAHV